MNSLSMSFSVPPLPSGMQKREKRKAQKAVEPKMNPPWSRALTRQVWDVERHGELDSDAGNGVEGVGRISEPGSRDLGGNDVRKGCLAELESSTKHGKHSDDACSDDSCLRATVPSQPMVKSTAVCRAAPAAISRT
ncbi:hypothetical protein DL766_007118 [Monosporascus sp. MC13-8B]|uniref:Uncharacterized protein n=1 Tax=Monosporascus cannonballus TaxID=155416 RepID=A0ABY0H9N9_9PEZI|nr:hypothetical protein DL762_003946 [Monosporascus cannonballus]RYO94819.1 hypothetical protein DL763_003923 [Monosporascus cannonballus]RYP25313.1 hypothetical protein DL766_007118 [Monosporascus sp. MC13-8B]